MVRARSCLMRAHVPSLHQQPATLPSLSIWEKMPPNISNTSNIKVHHDALRFSKPLFAQFCSFFALFEYLWATVLVSIGMPCLLVSGLSCSETLQVRLEMVLTEVSLLAIMMVRFCVTWAQTQATDIARLDILEASWEHLWARRYRSWFCKLSSGLQQVISVCSSRILGLEVLRCLRTSKDNGGCLSVCLYAKLE